MINKELWGNTKDGKEVYRYTLTNEHGTKAILTDFGAVLVSLFTADKHGDFSDIVLGFDHLEDYFENPPSFGAVIGRNANRIKGASICINNKTYQLEANDNGINNLHSDPFGYHKRLWNADTFTNEIGDNVRFFIDSPNGDQGYPGNLSVSITYTLTDDNSLILHYEATTDADTIVNLTNHSYFNLSGHDSGDTLDHIVWIDADKFTIADKYSIPTGELVDVTNTPMDFRTPTRIGRHINDNYEPLIFGNGYDHNWVLNHKDSLDLVASATDPKSGRVLEVFTDLPGIQFYTGNFLNGSLTGKDEYVYNQRDGICFETQHFPDAIHHPNFPSPILKAGETYDTTTIYHFDITKEQ